MSAAPIVVDLPTGEVAEVSKLEHFAGWQVAYWGSRDDYLADRAADWRADLATVSETFSTLAEALESLS